MDKNMCTEQKLKFIHRFIKSSMPETHLLKICLFHNLKIYTIVRLIIFKQYVSCT